MMKQCIRNAAHNADIILITHSHFDHYRDYEYLMHGLSSKTDTAKYLNISRPTLNKYIRLYSVIYDYAAEYNERFGQIFPIARLKMDYKYSEILNMLVKYLEHGKRCTFNGSEIS